MKTSLFFWYNGFTAKHIFSQKEREVFNFSLDYNASGSGYLVKEILNAAYPSINTKNGS